MKIRAIAFLSIGLALVIAGCAPVNPTPGTVTASDMASFQKVFMSSYYAERGGVPAGARGLTPFLKIAPPAEAAGARTTINTAGLTDAHFASLSPKTFVNYPEPGQSTTFTITTKDAANKVYDITATTTYASDDLRKTYVEEYYVMDGNPTFPGVGANTTWGPEDAIVRLSGSTWVQDQKARVQQVLTFTDGTTRTETIVSQTDAGSHPTFNPFPVTDSLDFGQAFVPVTPASDPTVVFSSVVIYYITPSVNTNYWFWQGTQAKTILGIRYYTETKLSPGTVQGFNSYTVSFEKTVDTLTTTGGSYTTTLQTVFAGSQFSTLAETVLRQKVTYDLDNVGTGNIILSTGSKTTNMKTRVADITSQAGFYLTQTNDNFVQLSADASNVYTPTGAVAEIIAGTPAAYLNLRTLHGATGTQDLATNSVGTGDLAILYTSIVEGNGVVLTGSTVPSNVQPTGVLWTYNGTQGTTMQSATVPALGNTGTVEAWVYIDQLTDTGGIVHKGELPDFSDEAWSLQFWGNQGQIAWVIDRPTSGGAQYDLLTSKINLNTKKWYYLVATWDATANPKYNKLYINGVENNTMVPSYNGTTWNPEADAGNNKKVIVGSQLPVQYNTTYGYFGFNGKINGVNVSASPMSAATVASNYATYVLQTANW
jgi:hypothetical protein